jgi:type III secretion protein L
MQSPFRIIKKEIDFNPGKKVIKKADFSQFLEAQDLLNHARDLGKSLIADANNEAESIRQKAYEEGKKNAGKELNEFIFSTKKHIDDITQKTAATLSEMVEVCVRKLLGEFTQEQLLVLLVKKSLEPLERDNKVKLWVHPASIDTFEDSLDFIFQNKGFSLGEVAIDETIAVDECLVEYNIGFLVVKATEQIETVIEIMKENFGGHALSGENQG